MSKQVSKQPQSVAELLSKSFPALRLYWPNLQTCSPKQAAFLALQNREAFFGGAAGPGKSDALLAAALQYVDVPGYSALILRRSYAALALSGAIMDRAIQWLTPFKQAKQVHWNSNTYTFTFPSGAALTFGYCESENDVYRYQGAEFQYVAFDELTQFSEEQYVYLFSRQRAVEDIPVPLRMRSASNPGGIGHTWVKKRFIKERKEGVVWIPATLDDHPDEKYKAGYRESLSNLGEVLRHQLEEGDWDAEMGLAYPEIREETHFVERFELPKHWERFESMDYGTTAPTAWLLYAVDEDSNIIVADEYYRPNTLPDEDSTEILRRRLNWWERKDQQGWPIRHNCYGDPSSIRERLVQRDDFGQPMTLQDLFQQHGLYILPANNRRQVGYVSIRKLLKPDPQRRFPLWHKRAGDWGSPRLFIVRDRCPNVVSQLQDAILADGENDPERGEVVDAKWERRYGHAHASLRYGLTTFISPSAPQDEQEPQTPDEIRAAYFKRQQTHLREQAAARQRYMETEYTTWGG